MATYINRHLRQGPTLDGKAGVDLQLMMDKIHLPIDLNAQRWGLFRRGRIPTSGCTEMYYLHRVAGVCDEDLGSGVQPSLTWRCWSTKERLFAKTVWCSAICLGVYDSATSDNMVSGFERSRWVGGSGIIFNCIGPCWVGGTASSAENSTILHHESCWLSPEKHMQWE